MSFYKNKYSTRIVFLLIISIAISGCNKPNTVYSDSFNTNLDNWVIEQMEDGTVGIDNEQLDISQGNGAVIWFKHKLQAPITIEYDITVVDQGGKYDRVADMNCFWMANDPASKNDFFKNSKQRGGVFSNYFSHSLYYVGIGGHNNTKTRFRRYSGDGERPLKPEHDLSNPKYLIKSNNKNHIKIIINNNTTQFYRNNILVYNVEDSNPYVSGYFGIRSFKNHLLVDDFNVTKP